MRIFVASDKVSISTRTSCDRTCRPRARPTFRVALQVELIVQVHVVGLDVIAKRAPERVLLWIDNADLGSTKLDAFDGDQAAGYEPRDERFRALRLGL